MALPAGVTFAAAQQDGGGPELAILHTQAFTVQAGIRVVGSRPFVVIATSIGLISLDAINHNLFGYFRATGVGYTALGIPIEPPQQLGDELSIALGTAGAQVAVTCTTGAPPRRRYPAVVRARHNANLRRWSVIGGGKSWFPPLTVCDRALGGVGRRSSQRAP
jgi:hypothetical protein